MAAGSQPAAPEIICTVIGSMGHVQLNRPRALNALTLGMVRALAQALDDWAADPAIAHVVVTGAGDKAFCAGGDIRLLHDLGRQGRIEEARGFWREEYVLNHRIKTYPKPYVAIIDGIVMGGGVGISLHGSHRVAGERFQFAMPEVGIGFFPDVGATHALPRLPGQTGTYLAMTGERVGQADALALGLATHAASSSALPALLEDLSTGEAVDAVLARHRHDPGPAPLLSHRALIDQAFAADRAEVIVARLSAAMARDPFAARLLEVMARNSPTSMKLALAQMRVGKAMSFAEAMGTEFRIVSRIALGHDFYEGVRALIIDKDQAPRWQPATLHAVSEADVAAFFAPLPDELAL